jgi:hypothetical protein
MYPKVVESLPAFTFEGYETWSGNAVRAGDVWFAGPATYAADSMPGNALDPPITGNALQLVGGQLYRVTEGIPGKTGNAFWVEFPRVPRPDPVSGFVVIEFSLIYISGSPWGVENLRVNCNFEGTLSSYTQAPVEIGPESWLVTCLADNPAHSKRLWVQSTLDMEQIHYVTKIETATPPLGAWRLRQRQTLTGSDSWPLRQRQNGHHSGSWPLRQKQRGV